MIALLFALAAAAGNLAGGWAVIRHERRSLEVIELFVAFGAGFMIAVVLFDVTPEAIGRSPAAPAYMLAGYLTVHLAQHVLAPHFHFGEETHRVSSRQGYTAALGLSLHTFFDGVAIASGFLVGTHLGVMLFLAVFLHKLPEGLAVASLMLAGGQSRGRALGAAALLGGATVAGVLVTELSEALVRHGLALSAGVTLYVAASNMVPEFQVGRGWRMPLMFFGGVGAFLLSHLLLGLAGL